MNAYELMKEYNTIKHEKNDYRKRSQDNRSKSNKQFYNKMYAQKEEELTKFKIRMRCLKEKQEGVK